MKRIVLAFAAVVTLNAGAVTTANAVEFVPGPGRVYVGPDSHYGDLNYVGCRTVVEYRVNQFGESIEVRRRICDW
jgi:hypothetical protein